MRTTREQMLTHIKRAGGASVGGLANALGLARMTVRQHLAGMERDGFVVSREERTGKGRPHFLFSLSDRGEEFFPKRYDRLADLLLQEVAVLDADDIAGLSPEEKKRKLLMKMAERVYLENEALVDGKSLAERVAVTAQILDEEGGFAEWRSDDGGYEIINYNCVYRWVVGSHGDLCEFDEAVISRLLGQDVQCYQFMNQGAECCRFVVRQEDGRGKGG